MQKGGPKNSRVSKTWKGRVVQNPTILPKTQAKCFELN